MLTRNLKLITAFFVIFFCASAYAAQSTAESKTPWTNKLTLSGTAGWNFNQKFIGATQGNAFNLGGAINNTTKFAQDKNQVNITVGLLEAWQKSADYNYWSKSADNFEIKADYLYNLNSWTGFIAAASLNMPLLPNIDHQSSKYAYNLPDKSLSNSESFQLTGSFQPLTLQQSAGWYFEFLDKKTIAWRVEASAMMQEIFAKGQYNIISKDSSKKIMNLGMLDTFFQFGPSVGTKIQGTLLNKYLTYAVSAKLFMALVSISGMEDDQPNPSVFNLDINSTVSFNFSKYISLDWVFKSLLVPELQEEFQIQSNLLLSFNYDY